MSLYNELGDLHQGNQGWSYSSSCNQTSGAFTSSTSVRGQPSGSAVQPQSEILSSLLSSPPSSNRYVQIQLQETQASQKEGDTLHLDENGIVIGREEVILTDNSPVAATGYLASAAQNQQHLSSDMHSAYIHKAGHAQFHMSAPQDFAAQRDLVNPPQSVVSYGQDSYNSACNPQLQRLQPGYMQQQGLGQQPHSQLQQNHGQQQGGVGQQSLSRHLQGQPPSHGQLQAVGQQPMAQHSQPGQQQTSRHSLGQPQLHQQMAPHQHYLGSQMNATHGQQMNVGQQSLGQHGQQVEMNHLQLNQSLGQQHGVGQHPLGQQQVASHQPLVGQLSTIQVNHLNQNTPQRPLRPVNMLGDAPASSHSSPLTGHNVQFANGNKAVVLPNQQAQQNRHTVLIHCFPQNVIPQQTQQPLQNHQYLNQMAMSNQQTFPGQSFHNQQSVSRLTHNDQLSFQNHQLLPNHQSLQTQQTLQHQANMQNHHPMQNNAPSHIEVTNQQSIDPNAGFTGQLHGQRIGMDQQQQQACVQQQGCSQQSQNCVNQEQQESAKQQGLLLVVHPNSALSGAHFVSSHHNTQQIPLQQSPQNAVKVSMGSPLTHNLPNSPQVTQQAPSQVALNSSPQLNIQQSPQVSLQSSPQMSLQSSPQQYSLQGSPNPLQSSAHIMMLQTPQLPQSQSQMTHQNISQVGHLSQLTGTPHGQNSHGQALQLQNASQVLHGLSQRPFQVSQSVEGNMTGGGQLAGQTADPTVTSSVKGRGQSRGKGSRGGRGGRGRGRGNANSATGLHMAPDHFRPEATYPSGMESSGVEQAVSHADNAMLSQDQGTQELSMPTPQSEHSNSSPLQGTHMPCLNSYSPPSISSASVPRLSATNEVWPTPMPCIKQEQCDSPPELVVEALSSSSQQSSDCPALSPTSFLEDIKPSPPVPPAAPVVSMPEVVSPPAQVQPAKPVVAQSPEQKPELTPPPKRKLAEDEEGHAVCKYCGYCSSNFEVCEGCKRKLPPDVKVVVKKRKTENAEQGDERERTCGGGKVNSVPSGAGTVVNRRTSLYTNKLQTQGTAFSNTLSSDLPGKITGQSTYTRRRGSGARGSYRSKKPKEPVTVTISSDEDEDPSLDTSQRLSVSSVASNLNTPDEEDGFFSAPVSKPNSFGTSRRNKMQDASGQCVSQSQAVDGVFFEVRGVRIGSMRTSGLEVRFRTQNIVFKVKSDTTQQELDFFLCVTEVTWIKFSLSPSQPVLFIKVTPDCGMRLRSLLKMVPDSPEVFDPGSQDIQKNMIVVIVDKVLNEPGMRQMLQLYSQVQNLSDFLQEINYDSANDLLVKSTPPVLAHLPGELMLRSYQKYKTSTQSLPAQVVNDRGDYGTGGVEGQTIEANGPLSMGGDLSNDANETMNSQEGRGSRSPSPKTGFVGPIEKLLSYPPPPAKGAITITNEDLYCLNGGEFLNDVILDFYLKYLFNEKLSEADRQRTHIFSSFFYKRLTQRQNKSSQDEEEKMTPPQRRHSRVKTWTRHVDIFSKDFLLIPINEKAHWFLAVVCFPGMMAQEHINYQPASSPFYEDVGQGGDAMSTPPQQPKGDHVLGKVISAETAKKEKSMYNVGLRQACILIMDSLMGPSRNNVIRILKEYLQVEWDLKKGTERNMLKTVRGGCPKVPQQTNYSDCGVFVLQYAESFFENPIASFSIPMRLESWFPLSKVERKRCDIRSLILRLQTEASR
ncbi:uncharacterized protein LOC143282710 isoform X2 [Babylonia areolata]|uniref:uncharacterized protein LOC143282710 isoform X2 n=1 Tax=Babylonia areolata TaxID=304850 RepID=UPI003FCFE716